MSFDNHDLSTESKAVGGADAPVEHSIDNKALVANDWNDAELHGAPCPEWDALMETVVHITPGTQFSEYPDKKKSTKENKWFGAPITWEDYIEGDEGQKSAFAANRRAAWGASRHTASNTKEGSGAMMGNCQGFRRNQAVTSICALVLDVDSGQYDFDAALEIVEAFGKAAIISTSHSHLTEELLVPYDNVVDHSGCEGKPDLSQVKAYMRDKLGYADEVVDSVEIAEMPAITPKGWKIRLDVAPIPKLRIIFPLAEGDVELVDLANKQVEAQNVVKTKILGVSKLLGIPTDPATVDVARFYFAARHKPGSEYRTVVFQAPPISFHDIPVENTGNSGKKSKKAVNQAIPSTNDFKPGPVYLKCGFNLIAWNRDHGNAFKVVELLDLLKWEVRTGSVSLQTVEILCPNDALHSNAGDPNDTACFARNPMGQEGFHLSCRHGHCQPLPKLEMLSLLEEQIELPEGYERLAELMCEGEFYHDGEDRAPDEYRDGNGPSKPRITAVTDADATPESIRAACQSMLNKAKLSKKFSAKSGKIGKYKPKEDGKGEWVTICDPFEVVGRTYSESGDGQGLIIRFAADRDGAPIYEETVSKELLANDPRKVIAQLVDRGLWIMASADARSAVPELLSSIRDVPDIVTVTQPGWHGDVFISPSGDFFSDANGEYRLAPKLLLKHPAQAGSLEGWLKSTSAALECQNSDLLSIGLFSGFAGCLVNLLNVPVSPILNFAGTTTRGKTTAQRLGASVWANPIKGGLLTKFNASDNAIENIAVQASGTVLALDEGGQAARDSAQFQATVFKLAEGSGKTRMSPSGEARDIKSWTTCFTISEEVGFGDKVKREDANAAAGAVARCWEISFSDTKDLNLETTKMIDNVAENFGWAGPIFVRHIIEEGYHKCPDQLNKRIEDASKALLAGFNDLQPQHRRLAASAAFLQVAGEIAQEAGLVPVEFDVHGAVKRVLTISLESMSGAMNPKVTALNKLREGILRRIGVDVIAIDDAEAGSYRAVSAYFGYKSADGSLDTKQGSRGGHQQPPMDRIYCVPVDEMLKISGGMMRSSHLASELKSLGFLVPQSNNNNQWNTIPGIGKIKHYRVSGAFFHSEEDSKAADAASDGSGADLGMAAE
ncbi:MAG: DUF927 domain-containing protein [Tateyamaria sp.]|uniref:DUF927 domain-containing protein n=1 Tax=Tateyamaria sp. TaxID=1929288 RepID=UPI0032A01A61